MSTGVEWVEAPVAAPADGAMVAVEVAGEKVVLVGADGGLYAVEDSCPHASVELSKGRVRGCLLECPFHGGKIDVRDGSPASPPIRRPARTFPVRVDGDRVVVGMPVGVSGQENGNA